MVEIRLKTVEYAQFNFRHRFWPNLFQFGQNSTHDWFFVRRFGLNSASLEKFQPILTLVPPKSVAEFQLCAFDRFQTNFDHFGRKQNYCVLLVLQISLKAFLMLRGLLKRRNKLFQHWQRHVTDEKKLLLKSRYTEESLYSKLSRELEKFYYTERFY
jgi:hypothetical protein